MADRYGKLLTKLRAGRRGNPREAYGKVRAIRLDMASQDAAQNDIIALALLPALLHLLHVPDTVTWPLCSAAAASIFTLVLVIQFRRRRAVEGHFPPWVIIIYVLSILAVAGLWLNVAGYPFLPSAGPYAVVLTWALCIFGFIFVRTIELFLHRTPPA